MKTNTNSTVLSVERVNEILEERGVNVAKFWDYVGGGDRVPVLADDIDSLIASIED